MKRFFLLTVIMILCVGLFSISASAASASATLTGPSTVRAGDTITLTFNLNGTGIVSATGKLNYDANVLELKSTEQKINSAWAVDFGTNNFIAIDNTLEKPINSNTALLAVTFKVKSNVAVGTKISVSYTDIAVVTTTETKIGTATYSATVAAPLSTDNNLASLTVSNATISPAFSAGTTSYTASVPFEVSKLNVSATAADGKAKVSVNSPNLTPNGTTNVTITVTAENGSKKTYTISVKRAQDPNYVASGNNNLSGISVDGFLLSPVFSAENTQYVIWLPYETISVKISGTAADSKASVEVVGGDNLAAGQDNPVKVICTAENGDKKEYTVIVKRAAAHDGTVEDIPNETTPPETEPSDTTPPETAPSETNPTDNATNTAPENNGGVAWWWLVVVGIVALAAGLVGGFFGKDIIKKK